MVEIRSHDCNTKSEAEIVRVFVRLLASAEGRETGRCSLMVPATAYENWLWLENDMKGVANLGRDVTCESE